MKHPLGIFLYFVSMLFVFPGSGISQLRDLRTTTDETNRDTIPDGVTPLDTAVPMSYVFIDNFQELHTDTDSFGWKDLHHDPLPFPAAHLGNLGSAFRSLAVPSRFDLGFTTGWSQYDPYYVHEQTFKYYNQATPIGKVKYSQAGKDDTYLTLNFGRSFANGVNLSIDYRRINQVGEFGHQKQLNTGLGFGVWHDAPSGKYDAFYNFISNAAITEENGGITSDMFIGDPFFLDASIPTRITMGVSSHKHREFITKQIFHLAPDSASLGFDVWMKAAYKTALFKFVDESAFNYPEYYSSQFLVDERGIRHYVYAQTYDASVGIALPWTAAHSTIEASLRYKNIRLEQEPEQRNIHELYLEANGVFQWIEPLKLRGALSLGLGQAEGNYRFVADAEINTGVLGKLYGNWSVMSRNPSLVESKIYINQEQIYNTDFKNPFLSELEVGLKMEKIDLEAGIKWSVFDNYIYFDTSAMPGQVNGTFSIQQFHLAKEFDFRWAGAGGKVIWQPDPRDELAIPELAVAGHMFGRIGLFKRKLILIPGVDATYFSRYSGVNYFPVHGVYYLTADDAIPDYTRFDIGLGMKVNFLKIYLRMEDVEGFFKDRVLYQADLYPHFRGYFRIGIEAGFFN